MREFGVILSIVIGFAFVYVLFTGEPTLIEKISKLSHNYVDQQLTAIQKKVE